MKHRAQRIAAGRYVYRGRWIIRTAWEGDGPRGGTIWRWELGTEDRYGAVNLDGYSPHRTLAEAKDTIDREHANARSDD